MAWKPDPTRHGKCGRWRAQAQQEIRAAVAAAAAETMPKRRAGAAATARSRDADAALGPRPPEPMTVSRQVMEMRMFEKFRAKKAKERAYLASQVLRRSARPEYDRATREFLRRSAEEWAACEPRVPTLEALCVKFVAADLRDVSAEEIAALATMPPSVKEEVLRQSALLALKAHSSGQPRGVLTNSLLEGLLDGNMTCLPLRCTEITDDFVQIIEPVAESAAAGSAAQAQSADHAWDADFDASADGEKEAAEAEDDAADSWETAYWLHDAIQVRGVHKLVELDISFCPHLTEDVVELLAKACPGLQALAMAGNFNTGESSYYMLSTLGDENNFRTLRYVDVSCCAWVSFELMLQSGVLSRHRLETLRTLRAEVCPEITKVIEADIPELPPFGASRGLPRRENPSVSSSPSEDGGAAALAASWDALFDAAGDSDDAGGATLTASLPPFVNFEDSAPTRLRLASHGLHLHKSLEWFDPPKGLGVPGMRWTLTLNRGASRSRALRVATSFTGHDASAFD